MGKSNLSAGGGKASSKSNWEKPYAGFPLSYHPPSGRLYKKIRGRRFYFGYAKDWQAALAKYQEEIDDLQAGREPRDRTGETTVRDLLNRFLTEKHGQLDTGELSQRSFNDYKRICDTLAKSIGLNRTVTDIGTDDFSKLKKTFAKHGGLVHVGNEITRVKVVFNFAWQSGLIATPMRYGPMFRRPKKQALRKEKRANGKCKMFEAAELRRILDGAEQPLKAMLLLACNAGMGPSDIGQLPLDAIDWKGGWINHARAKTQVDRRVPLWAETTEALKEAIGQRPTPKQDVAKGLVFVTRWGGPWHVEESRTPIAAEFRKLLDRLDSTAEAKAKEDGTEPPAKLYKQGRGIYACRHVLQTVGEESGDVIAVRQIMGHSVNDISEFYRERISDERLRAVVDHVRKWLFA